MNWTRSGRGLLAGLLLAGGGVSSALERPADLVVRNGRVLTVDAAFRVAEAVAIRDGVFVRVGTNADVKPLVGPATRVIDAKGMSVVPGLVDSHVHALGVAAAEAVDPFRELRTLGRAAGVGSREGEQDSRRTVDLDAADLPAADPRASLPHPRRAGCRHRPTPGRGGRGIRGHAQHRERYEAAGITRDTQPPQGGIVVKEASGEPTGLLRNAGPLLASHQPRGRDGEDVPLGFLEEVHRRYNRVGITSVIERGANPEGYRAYRRLEQQGRLHVRATVTLRLASDGTIEGAERSIRALGLRFGEGDERVKVGPLKLVVDGGILLGNAYLREPYGRKAGALYGFDDPGYRGSLSLAPDQIRNIVRTGHRLGWQMSSHVTGDAGVDAVLDAVEAADADSPIRERRYTLIHAYFPDAATARRAARLGVCVDTQPAWYYKDADVLANTLGEERLRPFIGLREWIQAGVKVAVNTDHMFGLDPRAALNPFDPFLTMYVAVTRRTEGGRVLGPEQAVSRAEALRMMTADAAYLSFDETKKGSIEVGKLGDLAVLSEDFMACPEDRIREIHVVATVLGGQLVHDENP